MHSRAVLFLSLFALSGLVIVGSIALHLATASAAAESSVLRSPWEDEVDAAPGRSSISGLTRDTSRSAIISDEADAGLSLRERSTADSLETLLRRVHVMFEPEGSEVSTAMIPYLAEVISIINQHEALVYQIEVVEPDAALARRRAETFNDVIRLNVLEPSNLRIVGRQGLHSVHVDVSAS